MTRPIHIFGEPIIDKAAIDQLQNCLLEDSIGVLTADAHKGYAQPVGGAIAYKNHISPSGVGYDIGCGNLAVKLDLLYYDIKKDMPKIMDEIYYRISFGMGRPNNEPVDHPILDKIAPPERYNSIIDIETWNKQHKLACDQLGTVGGGNHFVDIFEDEHGYVWVGVHFGSRGYGHKIASGYLALAHGLKWGDRVSEAIDSKPALLDVNTYLGQAYIEDMKLAGEYAHAGREVVVRKVLDILGYHIDGVLGYVHNHHNFAWRENHNDEWYWVVRKGCTPAFPGQEGFIGANMFDMSVIIEGVDSPESAKGLYSTVHGAGRILSRTQAAGKKKWIRGEDGKKRPQIVGKGLVDFDAVKYEGQLRGVHLRGAGPDEAPMCYKNLQEVLEYQGDTIKILHRLKPVGVAMAGAEVEDPYRD